MMDDIFVVIGRLFEHLAAFIGYLLARPIHWTTPF